MDGKWEFMKIGMDSLSFENGASGVEKGWMNFTPIPYTNLVPSD